MVERLEASLKTARREASEALAVASRTERALEAVLSIMGLSQEAVAELLELP